MLATAASANRMTVVAVPVGNFKNRTQLVVIQGVSIAVYKALGVRMRYADSSGGSVGFDS